MTKTFAAQVNNWKNKTVGQMTGIAKGSAQDVFELMTRRQASAGETGSYKEGFVPVDTGFLIGSQVGSVSGGATMTGDIDYTTLVIGMELGDTVSAGFTAPYARHVEYGTSRMGGRFFVRNAAVQWPVIVDANAALFGDA